MENYKIHNLSEYFSLIEKLELQECISRGESGKFSRILASAFRPFEQCGKYYTKAQQQEFYHYIGNNLTEMQKKHFAAYAQHSGIPTNLIDFTTSPLVSLFFASYDEGKMVDSSGYVYFIKKKRLLPIDEQVEAGYSGELMNFPENDHDDNVIDKWMEEYLRGTESGIGGSYDTDQFLAEYIHILGSFLQMVREQLEDYSLTLMYRRLVSLCDTFEREAWRAVNMGDYGQRFEYLNKYLLQFLESFLEILEDGDIIEDLVRTRTILNESGIPNVLFRRFVHISEDPFCEYSGNRGMVAGTEEGEGYTVITPKELLKVFLSICLEFSVYSTQKDYYLPFYATYSPPNISGRVSMQNSIFICQTYHAGLRHWNELEPSPTLVTQRIEPDVVVEIWDKSRILRQLDMVGINLKTIYGDHDNIARYIKGKL